MMFTECSLAFLHCFEIAKDEAVDQCMATDVLELGSEHGDAAALPNAIYCLFPRADWVLLSAEFGHATHFQDLNNITSSLTLASRGFWKCDCVPAI